MLVRTPFILLVILVLAGPGPSAATMREAVEGSADRPGRAVEAPDREDTATHRTADAGRYRVSIKALASPIPINRIHNWTVRVLRPDGTPVTDAAIAFDGGMPDHGHGFPTTPRVTRHIGNGTWLIEGVKFNMTGWWRFEFDIREGKTSDRVAFNVVLED